MSTLMKKRKMVAMEAAMIAKKRRYARNEFDPSIAPRANMRIAGNNEVKYKDFSSSTTLSGSTISAIDLTAIGAGSDIRS